MQLYFCEMGLNIHQVLQCGKPQRFECVVEKQHCSLRCRCLQHKVTINQYLFIHDSRQAPSFLPSTPINFNYFLLPTRVLRYFIFLTHNTFRVASLYRVASFLMSSPKPLYRRGKKNGFCIKTDLNFWWAMRGGIVNGMLRATRVED